MNDALLKHYQGLWQTHGDTPATAQYSSRTSQEARYKILSEVADLNGTRVLDWGCGTGHLATWLHQRGIHCQYTGVDIVPDLLELGRKKHPNHRFGEMSDFASETFDWILISGVFNNRIEDNESFFREQINILWNKCSQGMSFNLMSSWVDFEDPELWYATPEKIFAYVKSITPFVTIRNEYLVKDVKVPFEFAVYAYRNPIRP